VFGFACGKLPTLHFTYGSSLGSYPANLELFGYLNLIIGDEIWTIGPQPVLCAARRCALRVC